MLKVDLFFHAKKGFKLKSVNAYSGKHMDAFSEISGKLICNPAVLRLAAWQVGKSRFKLPSYKTHLSPTHILEFENLSPDSAQFTSQSFSFSRHHVLGADMQNPALLTTVKSGAVGCVHFSEKRCCLFLRTSAASCGWLGHSPAYLQATIQI